MPEQQPEQPMEITGIHDGDMKKVRGIKTLPLKDKGKEGRTNNEPRSSTCDNYSLLPD